jgi:predicted acyltransferase
MAESKSILNSNRLYSLDFFRGFTMFLLIIEFTELFSLLVSPKLEGSFIFKIGTQFHHVPWIGLHFWDLIQPFFMFIVGVAIPYSYQNRLKKGQSHKQITGHVFKRAFLLLFLGWALYYSGPGEAAFRFQNVLAQLSVTYLIAYLIMNKSFRVQIIISIVLLAFTELVYRNFPVTGFDRAFIPNKNFGTWLDLQYGGADLNGHWVSFNAIPTAAHTIWGVLTGKLLMSSKTTNQKLKILIISGLTGIVVGYSLSFTTPIIKRIATSSFVLVSGGYTLLTLAFSYWMIDINKYKKGTLFFAIVGMNPLFIYLFAHVGGAEFIANIIHPFTSTLFSWTGSLTAEILASLVVIYLLWYMCYWLYKRNLFIKL